MARRTSLVSLGQISEINMTPLMDLTFILLITFIITFPLIEQGIIINLPKGKASDIQTESKTRSISISLDKKFYLDDEEIGFDELIETANQLGISEPDTTIHLRADQDLKYGDVMRLMKVLHDAKLTRVALVTVED